MSDTARQTSSPVAAAGGVAALPAFGLAGEDAALLGDALCDAFEGQGIDGRSFVHRMAQGEPLGAALGISKAIEEQLYERAHRWFTVGRPERAEPLFRALCTLAGGDGDYWVGLGVCLRLRDDHEGAALAFSTAARLRPDWAVPAFHAAELALRQGDIARATEHLERFQRLKDSAPETMVSEAARLAQAVAFRRETTAGRRSP